MAGQGLLLGALALVIVFRIGQIPVDSLALRLVGSALAVAGLVMLALGFRDLGPSLTPYPEPLEKAQLVDRGIYARVRHPLYGGLILGSTGISLVATSGAGLALAAGLAALLYRKSSWEEARLAARYPEYAAYRRRVRARLVPWRR